MPSYEEASRTKDRYANELFNNHPEIVSIAPQLARDATGRPTGEAVLSA